MQVQDAAQELADALYGFADAADRVVASTEPFVQRLKALAPRARRVARLLSEQPNEPGVALTATIRKVRLEREAIGFFAGLDKFFADLANDETNAAYDELRASLERLYDALKGVGVWHEEA